MFLKKLSNWNLVFILLIIIAICAATIIYSFQRIIISERGKTKSTLAAKSNDQYQKPSKTYPVSKEMMTSSSSNKLYEFETKSLKFKILNNTEKVLYLSVKFSCSQKTCTQNLKSHLGTLNAILIEKPNLEIITIQNLSLSLNDKLRVENYILKSSNRLLKALNDYSTVEDVSITALSRSL